jgi:hypothetical protein
MIVWASVAALPLGWYVYGVARAGSNTYGNIAFLVMTWVVLAPSAELVTCAGYLARSILPRASDPTMLICIWVLSLAGNYVLFVTIPNLLRALRRAHERGSDA